MVKLTVRCASQPAVAAPRRVAPTTLSPSRIRLFSTNGGSESWILPLSWVDKQIMSLAITENGVVPGPKVAIEGRTLTLAMPKGVPVVLRV